MTSPKPDQMSADAGNDDSEAQRDVLAAIVYRVNNGYYGDYGTHEETADAILAAGWRPPTEEAASRAKLAALRAWADDYRGLAEAAGLALGDTYAGEAFSDPTFERGSVAIVAVLQEWLDEHSPHLDSETEPPAEIALIADERRRVIAEEGRTPEQDDRYVFGQLVYAAAAYLGVNVQSPQVLEPGRLWPWEFRDFKPRDPQSNLVRAGQLIAAEIARLQRIKSRDSEGDKP